MKSPALAGGGAVVRAQRLFRDRRHAGRRRRLFLLLLAAALLITVLGVGFAVANSSLVALRYVTVEGTSRLSVAQVLDAADVRAGTSLVWLDPEAVSRRVARLRPVAAVQVSRRWPHGLLIHVSERRPAAVVSGPSGSELVDAAGVAFASTAAPPQGLVKLQVVGPVPGAGERAAQAAMRVLAQLPTRIRGRVSALRASSSLDVTAELRDGRTIVWGAPVDASTKVAVLRTLLRHPARVYDVSTPSVAVTR